LILIFLYNKLYKLHPMLSDVQFLHSALFFVLL